MHVCGLGGLSKKIGFAFNIQVTHLDAFFRVFPNADSRFVFG